MQEAKIKAADIAAENAESKHSGLCGRYVANAIDKSQNKTEKEVEKYRSGVNNAGDMGEKFLPSRGYSEKEDQKPENAKKGNVTVFKATPEAPYGHVQIKHDEKWISDKEQNQFQPNSQKPRSKYKIYE